MLSLKPDVLLFDECTSLLDPSSKQDLYDLFIKLKQQGITIIFTTNILDEIIYADQVLIMDHGEIVSSLSATETVKNLDIFETIKMQVPTKLKIFNKLLLSNKIDTLSEVELLKTISEMC